MKVIRNLKKTLVFILAFLADTYQDFSIRNYYRAFYLPGYFYKKRSLIELVSRMNKLAQIEKIEEKGEVYFKLTKKGGRLFEEIISLKKLSQRNWDGVWRIVIFDIKEIDRKIRNQIRNKLRKWGFAMWQESVYISPHPILSEIDEFLKVKKLFPKVVTMESKIVGVKNYDRFAWVVFRLNDLKSEYLALEKMIEKGKSDGEDFKKVIEDFQKLVLKDPFLPKDLIEEDWPRERIREKIKRLFW